MANECLVTKLKRTVDNENLEKFGHFKVTVYNQGNSAKNIRIAGSKVLFKGVEYNADANISVAAGDSGVLEVLDKYSITNVTTMDLEFDLSDKLRYSELIETINISNTHAKIDLSSLKNLSSLRVFLAQENSDNTGTFLGWTTTSLTQCNFHNNHKITGDIGWFGDQDNLTNLYICNSGITGNLEGFFKKKILRNNLQSVYSLFAGYGGNVKFGGESIAKDGTPNRCDFYIVDNGDNTYTCGIGYGAGASAAPHRYFATYNKTTDTWSDYNEVNTNS